MINPLLTTNDFSTIKQVNRYELEFDFSDFPENNGFEATAKITFVPKDKLNCVTLHSLGLHIHKASHTPPGSETTYNSTKITPNPQTQTVEISFDKPIRDTGTTLTIKFFGRVGTNFADGIYKVSNQNGFSGVYTHFKIANARKCFPCFDEPHLMANFRLRIKHPHEYYVLSNAHFIIDDDARSTTFHSTEPLSTYCFGFSLTKGLTNSTYYKVGRAKIAFHIPNGFDNTFVADIVVKAMTYFRSELGTPYFGEKLDVVAVDDYNLADDKPLPLVSHYGLIFVPLSVLSLNSRKPSTKDDHYRALAEMMNVVHGVARQWFGNIVSIKSWNDQWIQHGLAWFYSFAFVQKQYPEKKIEEYYAERITGVALRTDVPGGNTDYEPLHGAENCVLKHYAAFDNVFYICKAAAVFRMYAYDVKLEKFNEAVKGFLNNYRFAPVSTLDLQITMQNSTFENFERYTKAWIDTRFYPVISVTVSDNAKGQREYEAVPTLFNPNKASVPQQNWPIPVIYSSSDDFTKKAGEFMLKNRNIQLAGNNHRKKYFNFNFAGCGYYRISYNDRCLTEFMPYFKNKILPPVDRYSILSDLMEMGDFRSGSNYIKMMTLFVENIGEEYSIALWNVFLRFVTTRLEEAKKEHPEDVQKLYISMQKHFFHFEQTFLHSDNPRLSEEEMKILSEIIGSIFGVIYGSDPIIGMGPLENPTDFPAIKSTDKYDLTLNFDFPKSDLYTGKVVIDILVLQPFDVLCINCSGLEINAAFLGQNGKPLLNNNAEGIDKEKNEMVMLKFNATFNRGVYQLTVNFAGTIGTEEKDGIYKTQMSNGEWLLLTKFKNVRARKSFPCFDEPHLKGVFTYRISQETPLPVIAITPRNTETSKMYEFRESKPMAPCTFGFCIGQLMATEAKVGNVVIACYTPTYSRAINMAGRLYHVRSTLHFASQALVYFEKTFSQPYPGERIDVVAIPNNSPEALFFDSCYWSLLHVRENLFDPQNFTENPPKGFSERRWRLGIAKHIAQAWFGCMVTSKTWEEIWINSDFALLFAYFCIDEVCPHVKIWSYFVNEKLEAAHDPHENNGPPTTVQQNTKLTKEEIKLHSSGIRGVVVLRQFCYQIGVAEFHEACRDILKKFKFSSVTTTGIMDILFSSSFNLNKDSAKWLTLSSYPVVTMTFEESNGKRQYTLNQYVATRKGHYDTIDRLPFPVPLHVSTEHQPGVEATQVLFSTKSLFFESAKFDAGKWVNFNFGRRGFFRVNYPISLLNEFLTTFKAKAMPEIDRFTILSDFDAFMHEDTFEKLDFARIIFENIGEEDSDIVWAQLAVMTDTVLGYGGIYTTQTENFKKIAWRSITAEIQKGKNRLLPLGPIKSQQVDNYVRRKIEYYVEYIINRCKGGRPVDSSIRYG